MFGIGEILVLGSVVMLWRHGRRLAEVGAMVGNTVRAFRAGLNGAETDPPPQPPRLPSPPVAPLNRD